MFRIMSSRYKDEVIEEIDTFDTEGEAQVTLVEYQLAFGHDFALWIESVKGKLEVEAATEALAEAAADIAVCSAGRV